MPRPERNPFPLRTLNLAMLFGAALLLASCGAKEQPSKGTEGTDVKTEVKEGEDEHEGHDEHEGGEHGDSWLIDIGEHKFLGDVDFDVEDGILTLTVLDHKSREPHPHKIEGAKLNLALPGGSKQFDLEPLRGDEDLIGETSRYRVSDPALKGQKDLKGRVNLTIDGKSYVCDLSAVH